MIGANREAVTRVLTKLQDKGAVEVVNRRIHLRDHKVLEQEAEARPAARSLAS
jgi:hypothetical protein